MKLNPDTILERRPYLRLSLNSSDEVQVSPVEGRTIKCGLHALAILELFSRPLSVAAAIRQLGARYAAQGERVAAIATLFRLHEGGALRDVSARDAATTATHDPNAPTGGGATFENPPPVECPGADEIYFECALDETARELIPYRERVARSGRQTAPSPLPVPQPATLEPDPRAALEPDPRATLELDLRTTLEPDARAALELNPRVALELNPRVALQTGDEPPAHLSARLRFLDRFSPRRPLVWVEDAGTETLAPYWLTPEQARAFGQLAAGSLTPAELDAGVAARFAEARILIAQGGEDGEAARAQDWRRACEALRRDLQTTQYAVLRKIIHPLQLAALRRYFRALDERGHLRASSNKHYAHRRRSIYDEETARFVQQQINALVNRITPARVRPSHCQVSVYQPGAFLRRHKDQPQYVWNLSLVVDAEPELEEDGAWPICLEVEGETREVRLEIGDAVLYRGSEFTHWRDALPAGQSVTLLFCFFSPAGVEDETSKREG